jgi:phosphoribosylformylglycinamidine (FGAM) synthase-like enzyme
LLQVLGKMPNKTFTFNTSTPQLQPLSLPEGTTPQAALEAVLRLPSVGSKRFLTTKVDRHVTGERHNSVISSFCGGWVFGVLQTICLVRACVQHESVVAMIDE